ncbi:lipopolysaccharide transport periplasmic protein LptA [Tabrizicola piscis]|jgi:lipopolysaccharide export system protein LptA|uniref:Lipopolysaccharide transport periplasmic protein LptA n=1 Tax=Tabrizicola piscis TaxID=2494374 RepID=A0A3S8U6J5_9RHOB|nr:LptA/OstA family protein [Tabrizicola piscis]AZL59224.1 lipopolysaccharide transport periplasmic protein LptA [Tabrizicola piscis]
MALKQWSLALAASVALLSTAAVAQQATIAFGDLEQDTTQPVEVTADQLAVNNADGTALFSGNVKVVQGDMTLTAGEVEVKYGSEPGEIDQLLASGGVSVTNLGDAAKADGAVYTIKSGQIVMSGNVLLTQGPSSMQGQKLTINLTDGSGIMEGRVTTTFVPGEN